MAILRLQHSKRGETEGLEPRRLVGKVGVARSRQTHADQPGTKALPCRYDNAWATDLQPVEAKAGFIVLIFSHPRYLHAPCITGKRTIFQGIRGEFVQQKR